MNDNFLRKPVKQKTPGRNRERGVVDHVYFEIALGGRLSRRRLSRRIRDDVVQLLGYSLQVCKRRQ